MKWENKALMQFQGFSFRRRSERSFCEQPHLKQSNWHSDAPRRFPKAAHMKGPYNEGLDMCQTGMRDIFMVTEPAMFQFNRQGFGSLWWHKAALHLSWALERKRESRITGEISGIWPWLHPSLQSFLFLCSKMSADGKKEPPPYIIPGKPTAHTCSVNIHDHYRHLLTSLILSLFLFIWSSRKSRWWRESLPPPHSFHPTLHADTAICHARYSSHTWVSHFLEDLR